MKLRHYVWVCAVLITLLIANATATVFSNVTPYRNGGFVFSEGDGSSLTWQSSGFGNLNNTNDDDYCQTNNNVDRRSQLLGVSNHNFLTYVPAGVSVTAVELSIRLSAESCSSRAHYLNVIQFRKAGGTTHRFAYDDDVYRYCGGGNVFTIGSFSPAPTWALADFGNSFSVAVSVNEAYGNNMRSRLHYIKTRVRFQTNAIPTGITPSSRIGVNPGGTVSISGTGLVDVGNGVQCKFGSASNSPVVTGTFSSSTTVVCNVPAQVVYGTFPVTLSLDGGATWTSESVNFRYVCDVSVACAGGNAASCADDTQQCNCQPYWSGPKCTIANCTTLSNCNGHGSCNVVNGAPVCECSSDWTGPRCNDPSCSTLNGCNSHVNRGTCTAPGVCTCQPGYLQPDCANPDCSQVGNCNSVANGGTCTAPQTCSCNGGFSAPNCTATCSTPCGVNSQCIGNNTCACIAPYRPPDCLTSFDCLTRTNCSSSLGHGVCVGEQTCQCNPGWLLPDCSKPDCSVLSNCSNHGVCSAPYTCNCTSGYTNGDCSSPDCSSLNYCNIVNNGGTCVAPNTCSCNSGWDAFNNCSIPVCNAPGCHENQTCVGANVCQCKPGFIPPLCDMQYYCSDVNECSDHGSCVGINVCECELGWRLSPDCSIADCTQLNNCSGNGACTSPNVCSCFGQWSGADCSGEPLAAEDPEDTDMAPIIGGVVGGVGLLLIIAVILGIVLLRRRRLRHVNFREPSYNPIVFGQFTKMQYENANTDRLAPLAELLNAGDHAVAMALARTIAPTEKDAAARALCHFFVVNDFHAFMQRLIELEVQQCQSQNTLFRGNSLATAVFQVFSKIVGIRYLWNTLGVFLNELNLLSGGQQGSGNGTSSMGTSSMERNGSINNKTSLLNDDMEMEIDPSKMDGQASTLNKYKLLLTTQKLFTAIVSSVDMVPDDIRRVLHYTADAVVSRFPDSKYKAVGGLMFLRFVVPAITTPHTFGFFQVPPGEVTQRNLILLAKVLQNLANEIQFGSKEAHMAKLNDFIVENQEELHKFFDSISGSVNGTAVSVNNVPEHVPENALLFLHAYIHDHIKKIAADLNDVGEHATATKLQNLITELGEPARTKK